MKKSLFSAAIVLTLSGCASTFTIGSAGEKCPFTDMEGAGCVGMREIYTATENPNFNPAEFRDSNIQMQEKAAVKEEPGFFSRVFSGGDSEKKTDQDADTRTVMKEQNSQLESDNLVPWMEKPVPVRSQAKVMRIYIGPVQDIDGDVTAPGLVYTEIEERRWNFGEEMVQKPSRLTPISSGANVLDRLDARGSVGSQAPVPNSNSRFGNNVRPGGNNIQGLQGQ